MLSNPEEFLNNVLNETIKDEKTQIQFNELRIPGEFEKMESIWFYFPVREFRKAYPYCDFTCEVISKVQEGCKVVLVFNENKLEESLQKYQILKEKYQIKDTQIEIKVSNLTESWLRDTGLYFAINETKNELVNMKFKFDFWGNKCQNFNTKVFEKEGDCISKLVAEMGFPEISFNYIAEGGGRDSNGKGVMIMCKHLELKRNPHFTIEQIDQFFKKIFNLKVIIWIENPPCVDDQEMIKIYNRDFNSENEHLVSVDFVCDGHIDTIARFVSSDTIVYEYRNPEPLEKHHHYFFQEEGRRLRMLKETLEKAVDQDGKPFKLVQMPHGPEIEESFTCHDPYYQLLKRKDGQPICQKCPKYCTINTFRNTSYMNFVLANDVIIQNVYWMPGLRKMIKRIDNKAVKILQDLFPEKKIQTVNPISISLAGGLTHCICAHQPSVQT